ncbi:hypothetical protein [Xylanimonas ulmi]|uniref:Uncharacterized protein n=1 Tax=Xylanimonas ulmi TaxID=228973 RepID=A0A4Q7M0N0_9MICO|nr:hypothetical protein [Xylanibacterium ulmi]RZS60443.1 hypothetical protein EV386_0701 [Xylanibacterium ulmi]
MSRRYTGSDPTANRAIGAADKGSRKRHAQGCSVDGGPRRHNLRGFFCPACASDVDDRLESALIILDARRPL